MNANRDRNIVNRVLSWLRGALLLACLAACGGGEGEAPPPQAVLETARATSADIGPAGGVIEATGANGMAYRLEIPADALAQTLRITMTPLARIDHLPLSGGLVGAVDLQPSGLRLALPATLKIVAAAPPRTGVTLTGFSIAAAGANTARELAIAATAEVRVLVNHFSAWGAGFGTTQDLESLTVSVNRTPAEAAVFFANMAILADPGPQSADALRVAHLAIFDAVVLPMMQRATSDVEVLAAASEYYDWRAGWILFEASDQAAARLIDAIGPIESTQIASRKNVWDFSAGLKFGDAIRANNNLCRTEKSLAALGNVLFLQRRAESAIPEGVLLQNGIDRSAVLRNLCAQLLVTSRSLVQPLQIDQPHDLDATFSLQFGADPAVQAVPVRVIFGGSGVRFGKSPPANSNSVGEFTVAVTAEVSNAPVTISFIGCLVLEGSGVTDVCVGEDINRSSLNIAGQYRGTFRSTITTGSGQIVPVNVPINVTLTQTQNGPQGTWEVMLFNGPRGSLSAILSGLELLNFNLSQFMPCQGLFTGSATIDTASRRIVANYTGSDCLGTHANGVTEVVPGRIEAIDHSGAWGQFENGVLTQVFKVRQSGSTVDVSHMRREGGVLVCRAFYRATNVTSGFGASFRAAGPGVDAEPLAFAHVAWNEDSARVRGVLATVTNDLAGNIENFRLIPLATPPGGCNP